MLRLPVAINLVERPPDHRNKPSHGCGIGFCMLLFTHNKHGRLCTFAHSETFMTVMQHPKISSGNRLLDRLNDADLTLIKASMKQAHFASNEVIYDPGQNVATVYFPCGATLVSFLVSTEDGGAIETTLIGREGAVGGIVSQGKLPAYSRIMVQHGGDFVTVPISVLDEAKTKSRSLDNLFARYADCLVAQIFQATACNAAHSIEQRSAKWILSAIERTGASEVPLTQERLGGMLGVGRSYVSRVISRLKREGIVDVRRGHITVLDKELLIQQACSCDEAVRAHFDTVLAGLYPETGDGH
jgi:biotin operon repressor